MPRLWHLWYWRTVWGSWQAGKANPDLLTVDVFDTILRRSCHPDEIKFLTARHLWLIFSQGETTPWKLFHERKLCEEQLAIDAKRHGFDGEYRIRDVLQAWLMSVSSGLNESVRKSYAIELVEAERKFENERARLDPGIEDILKKWPHCPCAIASDFYMPAELVDELYKGKGLSRDIKRIYVSHDHGRSKVTGKLFEIIRQDFNVSPKRHLHVGDLFEVDVLPQRKAGGMAYWFRGSRKERRKRRFLDQAWKKRQRGDLRPYLCHMRRLWGNILPDKNIGSLERRLFEEGKKLCLLVGPLVLFVLEEAVREKVEDIWYFTREGELLAAAHEILSEMDVLGVNLPEAHLFEVSRQATFCASLEHGDIEELQPFFAMYPRQSLKTLFISLDLDMTSFLPFLENRGLSPEMEWNNPWENPDFLDLWNDPEFNARLQDQVIKKRSELFAYSASRGLINEKGRCYFITDIGWRGSIQDNLAKTFNKAFWSGRYLGLQRYLSEQPSNSKKKAFGPDLNSKKEGEELLEYVSPLEMVFNSPRGSVRGYESSNGNVKVIRVVDQAEQAVYEKYTRHLQAGLLVAMKVFGEVVREHGLTSSELKPEAMATLKRLIQNPPKVVGRAYFQLRHNELFGMGTFVDKNRAFPYGQLARSFFSAQARACINETLRESGWPQGFLAAKGLSVLTPIFNLRKQMGTKRET